MTIDNNLSSGDTAGTGMIRMADRSSRKVFFKKRRGCPLRDVTMEEINYKNVALLSKFISEGGRILPSRITNVCAKKQRKLKRAIKVARMIALLPFVAV